MAWADVRPGDVVLVDGEPLRIESTVFDSFAVLVDFVALSTGDGGSAAFPTTLVVSPAPEPVD